MPKPFSATYTLTAVDDDGICEAQQTVGAADLTIDGVLASSGTVTFSGGGYQIGIASTGNLSGVNFTVYGYDPELARTISETLAGPNNNTVETTLYFGSVTRVAVNGAVGTDVIVGHVDEFVSRMYPLDHYITNTSFGVNITGTVNYDVQCLLQDPQTVAHANQVWYDHATVAGASADAANSFDKCLDAIRVLVNSYSSAPTIEFRVIQENIR